MWHDVFGRPIQSFPPFGGWNPNPTAGDECISHLGSGADFQAVGCDVARPYMCMYEGKCSLSLYNCYSL